MARPKPPTTAAQPGHYYTWCEDDEQYIQAPLYAFRYPAFSAAGVKQRAAAAVSIVLSLPTKLLSVHKVISNTFGSDVSPELRFACAIFPCFIWLIVGLICIISPTTTSPLSSSLLDALFLRNTGEEAGLQQNCTCTDMVPLHACRETGKSDFDAGFDAGQQQHEGVMRGLESEVVSLVGLAGWLLVALTAAVVQMLVCSGGLGAAVRVQLVVWVGIAIRIYSAAPLLLTIYTGMLLYTVAASLLLAAGAPPSWCIYANALAVGVGMRILQ